MRILVGAIAAFLVFGTPAVAQTAPQVAGRSVLEIFDLAQWRNPQARNGVTTYTRPSRVASAVESLAVMRVAATQSEVLTTLTDVERFCEWVASCMSAQRLDRRGPDRFSYVMRLAFPAPFSDRFSVIDSSVHRYDERDTFLVGVPDARHRDYVLAGSRAMVRADGVYRLRRIDAQTTEISAYFAINPGGGIPLWATSAFSRQNTAASARSLRARLEG